MAGMATKTPDSLADFESREHTAKGKTRTVYTKGAGPAVIVLSEIPGITPEVAAFARRVADGGFTAVMPHLFGEPGKPMTLPYVARSMAFALLSPEFVMLAESRPSPITGWLLALARSAHSECGGPGVGAVGMCLTGGLPLAMLIDDTVVASVLSQPSLPLALAGGGRKRDLGLDSAGLARVKARVKGVSRIFGLRFSNDTICPPERFAQLREEFGEGFVGVEIDSSPTNPHGVSTRAHSVLAEEYRDDPDHPTYRAMQQVIDHFEKYLRPADRP